MGTEVGGILSVVEGLWWSCFDGFLVMYVYKMLEFDQDFSYLHLLCMCWFIWVCASLLVECIKGLTIWVHWYSRSRSWKGGLVCFIDSSFSQSNKPLGLLFPLLLSKHLAVQQTL